MYTPDVKQLYDTLLRARETKFETMMDGFEVFTTLEKQKDLFFYNVGNSWYGRKPKKQAEILELILSELDEIRQSGTVSLLRDNIHESCYAGKVISKYYKYYCEYKNAILNNQPHNFDIAAKKVMRETAQILYCLMIDNIFRHVYDETLHKYRNIAGESAAAKWIFNIDDRALEVERWAKSIQVTNDSLPFLTQGPAPLEWKGSIAELSSLFVELSEKGYIDLPSAVTYGGAGWETICRGITSLFTLSTRRSTSEGQPWTTLSTYFKTKEANGTYSKLESVKHKFSSIKPQKPSQADSE